MNLAAQERHDLAELLDSLTPAQWEHPTLCKGWTVRDVVAHVVSYDDLGYGALAGAFLAGRFQPTRVNDVRLAALRDWTPDRLVAHLREHPKPSGLTALLGGGVGLTDCLIHHQDIRRPLGLPRTVPADRLLEALGIALRAPLLPAKRNARALRFVATDLDWVVGHGPEVHGPAESLLITLAGRPAGLDDLGGAGLVTLRERVGGPGTAAAPPPVT